MSYEKNKWGTKDDNLIKKTSGEANKLFGHVVDTSGKIVKSVSGEGGLVGKAVDSSSNVLKGASGKANDMIGKTSDAPKNFYRSVTNHKKGSGTQAKEDDGSDEED